MSAVPNPSSGVEVSPVGNILRPRLDPWGTPHPGGASNLPISSRVLSVNWGLLCFHIHPLFIYLFIQNITVQAEFIAHFIHVLENRMRDRRVYFVYQVLRICWIEKKNEQQ